LKARAAVHPRLASWIIVGSLFPKGRRSAYRQSGDKNIIDFAVRGSMIQRKEREKERDKKRGSVKFL